MLTDSQSYKLFKCHLLRSETSTTGAVEAKLGKDEVVFIEEWKLWKTEQEPVLKQHRTDVRHNEKQHC